MTGEASITVHSTWRGVIGSFIGAGLVTFLGIIATVASAGGVGSLILLGVGLVLLAVVAFDYPIASTFDAESVTRRAVFRRHRLAWGDVDQLTRSRPGLAGSRGLRLGGLTAKVGRRRYLLVDQAESFDEFERLIAVVGDEEWELGLDDLLAPPADSTPTWLYRRKRWSGGSAPGQSGSG